MLSGDYITGVFVGQIKQFDKMFSGTVFPPFADPDVQANKVAQDYWDQKMSEPCGPDGPDDDPGDIAGDAHQKSLDFYETMTAMHHTVLNLFAAGVFHLFEQQAGTLLQDWTGTRPKYPFSALEELLKSKNGPAIDVKAAPTWSRVNELRLVANVVNTRRATRLTSCALSTTRTSSSRQCGAPTLRNTSATTTCSASR
jgi:hypothetical protein